MTSRVPAPRSESPGKSGVPAAKSQTVPTSTETVEYVTLTIADQLFGVPVLEVHDVLAEQRITRVPLAPPEVAGSLNLRGRIVTAIDVRRCLDLPTRPAGQKTMSVVVELRGELYSLIVDNVGEVLSVPATAFERNPPTLDPRWREVSNGVYRLDRGLLVVLAVDRLMRFGTELER